MSVIAVDTREPEQFGEFALWVVAAIIVVAVHMGLAVAYLWLKPEPEMRAEAPTIDVAFMPASNAAAAPPSIDQPEPVPTRMDQPQEQPKDPPAPLVPVQEPTIAMPQVEAMAPPEEPLPVLVKPELPPPPPEQATIVPDERPAEVAPVPEKPAIPEQSPRKILHDEKAEKRQALPKAVASPGAKPARLASAPNPGAESDGARAGRASWLSELVAHLRRFNTYAANGSKESGTVRISVTIDRSGHVLSRRIVAGSGSATIDHAALAVIERAQPFPRFSPSMTEAQLVEVIPLHLRPQ